MSSTHVPHTRPNNAIRNISAILSTIKACSIAGDIERGKEIHSKLIKTGIESNTYVANSLINMYSKLGDMVEAKKMFDKTPCQTVVSWNSLILGYVDNGEADLALQAFTSMIVQPNARTFTAAIKACTILKLKEEFKLAKGLALHSQATIHGVDTEVYVASSLVDMYSKCRSLPNARQAFEKSLVRDVVLWTALITGYVDNGEEEQGLEAFSCLLGEGCRPNARTYLAVVKACGNLAVREKGRYFEGKLVKMESLEKGMVFQTAAEENGFGNDTFLASGLIDMYSKCGSIFNAERVFEKVTRKDTVVWNSMMTAYVDHEEDMLALEIFSTMQSLGIPPNNRTFLAPLKACANLGEKSQERLSKLHALEKGMTFHSRAAAHGFDLRSNVFLASTLVDMYVKCGSMSDARRVFDWMESHDEVSWGSLLLGYVENGEPSLTLELFFSIIPERQDMCTTLMNSGVFMAAVKACISLAEAEPGTKLDGRVYKLETLEKGMAIHALASKNGLLNEEIALASSLVDMYSKCGSLEDAKRTFDRVDNPDVVAWTGLVNCYAANGQGEAALKVFLTMDCRPNPQTYVAVAKACGCASSLGAGRSLHAELCRVGIESNSVLQTCLVDLYGKCGSMVRARHVFDSGGQPDVVAWTSLVAGYSNQGDTDKVFSSFDEMQREGGFQPNAVTFVCVLAACSHAGLVEKGKRCFRVMEREYGVVCGLEHYLCMVDMLGRANKLEEAMDMVERMPYEANEAVWMTILGACNKWRNVEVGEVAFEKLVELKGDDAAAYSLVASLRRDRH